MLDVTIESDVRHDQHTRRKKRQLDLAPVERYSCGC